MKSIIFTALLTDNPEKAKALHSSTLAWRIPWTEEPGGLHSMGSLIVGHDWAASLSLFTFVQWRRKWQPTPVFLPGESQGWGKPGGLPSMGSHRVGHGWSDLAAAVTDIPRWIWLSLFSSFLNCECVGVKSTMISSRVWCHCIDSCWGECNFPHHCFHSITVTVNTVKKVSNILQLLGE